MRGEYSSVVTLTQKNNPPPTKLSTAYTAMPEYAVALELHVDKLELTGDVQSLPSKITMPTDTASAATTSLRKNNLTEIKALAIKLAVVNALQQKHLALALV